MEGQEHNSRTPAHRPKIKFFQKAEAARALAEGRPYKRLRSIIYRKELKSFLPAPPKLSYEVRRRALFLPSQKQKFWSLVEKTETCWLWLGPKASRGYGQFSVNRTHILAHIYAYVVTIGPFPKGLHLHHICEVHACVNPAHVEPLTPKQHSAKHKKLSLTEGQLPRCPFYEKEHE